MAAAQRRDLLSRVTPATCGVATTSGRCSRGWSGGGRLAGEDIEGGAGEVAMLEGGEQGVLVDQGAAGGIDQEGAGLHLREGRGRR